MGEDSLLSFFHIQLAEEPSLRVKIVALLSREVIFSCRAALSSARRVNFWQDAKNTRWTGEIMAGHKITKTGIYSPVDNDARGIT
jgi:hypothetical protein